MKRDEILTALEAAEYLQLHYRTLRRLLVSGQIRAFRMPGVEGSARPKEWRVPLSAIHDYLEQGNNQ